MPSKEWPPIGGEKTYIEILFNFVTGYTWAKLTLKDCRAKTTHFSDTQVSNKMRHGQNTILDKNLSIMKIKMAKSQCFNNVQEKK